MEEFLILCYLLEGFQELFTQKRELRAGVSSDLWSGWIQPCRHNSTRTAGFYWKWASHAAEALSKCTVWEQDQPESSRLQWKLNIEQRLVWISSQKTYILFRLTKETAWDSTWDLDCVGTDVQHINSKICISTAHPRPCHWWKLHCLLIELPLWSKLQERLEILHGHWAEANPAGLDAGHL